MGMFFLVLTVYVIPRQGVECVSIHDFGYWICISTITKGILWSILEVEFIYVNIWCSILISMYLGLNWHTFHLFFKCKLELVCNSIKNESNNIVEVNWIYLSFHMMENIFMLLHKSHSREMLSWEYSWQYKCQYTRHSERAHTRYSSWA